MNADFEATSMRWLILLLTAGWAISIPASAAQPDAHAFIGARGDFTVSTNRKTGEVLIHLASDVMVLLVKESAEAGADDADDLTGDAPSATRWRAQLIAGTFDDFAFGRGLSPAVVKARLDAQLHRKIFEVDQICGLTHTQWQKLKLAGAGDMKRYFDGVGRAESRFATYLEITAVVGMNEWLDEMRTLHSGCLLSRKGDVSLFFGNGSLFSNTLRNMLTAEQATKWRGLR